MGAGIRMDAEPAGTRRQAIDTGLRVFQVAKLVASVGVVGTFIALSDQPKHPFILLFLFWYLVYLIFETRFFWLYEKSRKGGKA